MRCACREARRKSRAPDDSCLKLTAVSYGALFDPWLNPAVEAWSIDRTHRIGQKQTVFA